MQRRFTFLVTGYAASLLCLGMGCFGFVSDPPAQLAGFTGGDITYTRYGVEITSGSGCPSLAESVSGTLNGQPLEVHEAGGWYWGGTPDGLGMQWNCRSPVLVGSRPHGTVTIQLVDGIDTWEMVVEDSRVEKTLKPQGPASSAGHLSVVTTPPSARWTLDLTHWRNTLTIKPTFESKDDFEDCYISVRDRSQQAKPGRTDIALYAVADINPGSMEIDLPEVPCAGPSTMAFYGDVTLRVSACPAGMTCASWDEVMLEVALEWTPAAP